MARRRFSPSRRGRRPSSLANLRGEGLERRQVMASDLAATLQDSLPAQYDHRSLSGYLTGPAAADPLEIVKQYMKSHASELGLTPRDVRTMKVTDRYTDADTGLTHIYFQQQINRIDVRNATFSAHVARDGRVVRVAGGFVPGGLNTPAPAPALTAEAALQALSGQLGLTQCGIAVSKPAAAGDVTRTVTLVSNGLSLDPIPARLEYVPAAGGVELGWKFVLRTPDGGHWYDVSAHASTGSLAAASDWIDHASYNVFPAPAKSPDDGPRVIVQNPHDPKASPFGWHDTNGVAGLEFTDTRGNNVFAQEDTADTNSDTGFRPSGGPALNFDFPLNLPGSPDTFQSAAITNLFYWNNVSHDIHHAYGFTEAAGNFQFMNYSGQGQGGDQVFADAQDGGGFNNANFATPPDGFSPRMQMYLWDFTNPLRDGDLDNEVIIHEYGHGVSNRLVGGPANANALNALQSGGMGEGWSDFWALMFLQKPTDSKTNSYPVGNYILGQPVSGPGIRRYPYAFNMKVNPLTYGNIRRNPEVHDQGEVWCSVLWDMNWLLIDKYGYSKDIGKGYSAGSAGNVLALKLVMDGLKLTPANPTFLQARDAILLADRNLTGGANQQAIWNAFARRGMGVSAKDGGNANSVNVTEAFDTPILKLLSTTPSGKVTAPVSSLVLSFSDQITPDAVVASNFIVRGDGADGTFGTGDDVTVAFANTDVKQSAPGVVAITLQSALVGTQRYMITLKGTGSNPLRNPDGSALGNTAAGQDLVRYFMVANPAEYAEPNDTLATARPVASTPGRIALDGTIGDGPYVSRDVDIYKAELAAGQPLTIDIDARSLPDGSTLDSFVTVFDASGKTLAFNDDDATSDSYLRFTSPATGTYYVGVSGLGNGGYDPKVAGSARTGSAGDYVLALTFGPTSAALSGSIGPVTPDPRTTAVDSIPLRFNRPVQGFDLADLSLTRNGSPVSLAGFTLSPAADRSIWTIAGRGLQEVTNANGSYRLLVKAAGSGITDIAGLPLVSDLIDEWQTELPTSPPTPPSTDAGDVLSKAQVVPATTTLSGAIGDGEFSARDVDLYRVVLAVGQRLIVDIDAQSRTPKSTLDSVVRVFGADGRSLAANDNDVRPGQASRDSYLVYTASQAGEYYVGISGFGNSSYDPTQVTTGRKPGSVGAYTAKLTLDAAPASLGTALAFAALPETSITTAKKRSAL